MASLHMTQFGPRYCMCYAWHWYSAITKKNIIWLHARFTLSVYGLGTGHMTWYHPYHWPLGDVVIIFKVHYPNVLWIKFMGTCKSVLMWMPQDTIDDESSLIEVMAKCRHAPSHYLNQCWSRSVSPYGVTRPRWDDIEFASTRVHYIPRIMLTVRALI